MPHVVANHILIPEIASLLREGKRVLFTPTGSSMRPFIEGGRDTVILELLPAVHKGDICLVQLPGGDESSHYVLHRVIQVENGQVTLQGDGNLRGIEHCRIADVLGTVVRIQTPWGRTKPLTNGLLWRTLFRPRWFWLKVYRHTIVKYAYN